MGIITGTYFTLRLCLMQYTLISRSDMYPKIRAWSGYGDSFTLRSTSNRILNIHSEYPSKCFHLVINMLYPE